METLSVVAARRIAINAQGYAGRARHGTTRDVERAVQELSCVQLDSISVVERSHRIALASRVGAYPARHRVATAARRPPVRVLGARGVPAAGRGLAAVPAGDGRRRPPLVGDVERTHAHLREEILDRIRARGPARLAGLRRRAAGGMWNRKPAKAMLDRLWNHGELVIAGRQGFQRLYDLPERVLPRERAGRADADRGGAARTLALKAVRARGALTEAGIVEHWRLKGGTKRVRPAVDGLVADGLLERVQVDDGGAPCSSAPAAELDLPAPTAAVLLSPFDNLLWDRPFARRVLGFDHLIEVYKQPHERRTATTSCRSSAATGSSDEPT